MTCLILPIENLGGSFTDTFRSLLTYKPPVPGSQIRRAVRCIGWDASWCGKKKIYIYNLARLSVLICSIIQTVSNLFVLNW